MYFFGIAGDVSWSDLLSTQFDEANLDRLRDTHIGQPSYFHIDFASRKIEWAIQFWVWLFH